MRTSKRLIALLAVAGALLLHACGGGGGGGDDGPATTLPPLNWDDPGASWDNVSWAR